MANGNTKKASNTAGAPGFEATLWSAAEKLKGNMDAGEYMSRPGLPRLAPGLSNDASGGRTETKAMASGLLEPMAQIKPDGSPWRRAHMDAISIMAEPGRIGHASGADGFLHLVFAEGGFAGHVRKHPLWFPSSNVPVVLTVCRARTRRRMTNIRSLSITFNSMNHADDGLGFMLLRAHGNL